MKNYIRVYNGTGFTIDILNSKHEIIKIISRAEKLAIKQQVVETIQDGIPVYETVYTVDPLPKGYDMYIVSKEYADFCKDKQNLYIPFKEIYSEKGIIVGWTGVSKVLCHK